MSPFSVFPATRSPFNNSINSWSNSERPAADLELVVAIAICQQWSLSTILLVVNWYFRNHLSLLYCIFDELHHQYVTARNKKYPRRAILVLHVSLNAFPPLCFYLIFFHYPLVPNISWHIWPKHGPCFFGIFSKNLTKNLSTSTDDPMKLVKPSWEIVVWVVPMPNRARRSPTLLPRLQPRLCDIPQKLWQVAQARNMSIGEHRHSCLTFKI